MNVDNLLDFKIIVRAGFFNTQFEFHIGDYFTALITYPNSKAYTFVVYDYYNDEPLSVNNVYTTKE